MPGVQTQCSDISLLERSSEAPDSSGSIADSNSITPFTFQYCRPRDSDVDVNTIAGYFNQLARAGVRFELQANTVIPITTFGKILNVKRTAEVGFALQKIKQLQVEQETTLRVSQAFSSLLLARDSLVILREADDILQQAMRRVEADLGGGEDAWDEEDATVDAGRD